MTDKLAAKHEFWRQVTYYSFINLTLWLSWVIAGIRDGWGVPWAFVPTVIGGVYLVLRMHRLGGVDAVRHRTIDAEAAEQKRRDTEAWRRPAAKQIEFSDGGSYTNLPAFHLQDVIDAREERRIEGRTDQSTAV